jgi:hypothetical protein
MFSDIYYIQKKSYDYVLKEDYVILVPIFPTALIQEPVNKVHISLDCDGVLFIKKGYAWDGPSGPAFDTPAFMRGSLVHDALYQLIRAERIDPRSSRKKADKILRNICKEDGMSRFRRWYVYWGLRMFGGQAAGIPILRK